MRRFIIPLFLMAMVFPGASAFGQQADKMDVIHIATPEYKDQTNKDGTGLYFDIVRGVYEPEGIKMTFEIVPWKRAEKMLEDKQADAMVSAIKRKERLTPKYPMFMEYLAAFFKKENIRDWKGSESLNNRTAVWLRGYDCHEDDRLKGITFKKWDEIDDYKTGLRLIEKGRYDFFIDALVDMNGYLKTDKPDMTIYQMETLNGQKTYMSFAKTEKSKKLIEIYDKRIMILFKSGELQKMYEKWDIKFTPDAWNE